MFKFQTRASFHLIVLVLISQLTLVACLPTGEDLASQSPLLAALERKSGLIAYIGTDGNIYTINQGGGKNQAVTTDAEVADSEESETAKSYLFPSWSPDGRILAFASYNGPLADPTKTSIQTASADGSGLTKIFDSDLVRPIFLSWSPSGEEVGFLTTAPSGTLLLQIGSANDEANRIIDAGQPVYWAWAPKGGQLLIHAGGASEAKLSVLTPGDQVIEEGLAIHPASFQAPSWTSDGDKLVLAAVDDEGNNALVIANVKGQSQSKLVDLGQRTVSFAASHDGRKVAYIIGDPEIPQAVLGRLSVVDIERPDKVVAAEGEQVVAFFWSPDSKRIAYFVPGRVPLASEPGTSDATEEENTVVVLSLYVINVGNGASKRISVFRPTPEFLSILPFFDQYHQSATIWSPDSKNLVITALSGGVPRVMIVNASGALEPRPIADGTLAFWSWK